MIPCFPTSGPLLTWCPSSPRVQIQLRGPSSLMASLVSLQPPELQGPLFPLPTPHRTAPLRTQKAFCFINTLVVHRLRLLALKGRTLPRPSQSPEWLAQGLQLTMDLIWICALGRRHEQEARSYPSLAQGPGYTRLRGHCSSETYSFLDT